MSFESGLRTTNSRIHPISGARFYGLGIDGETRCEHYHSSQDVIAIRFKCCDMFFACSACHQALSSHSPIRWSTAEWGASAILCGCCGEILTIGEYLDSNFQCPICQAHFNPGCRNHYDHYFEPL